MEIDFAKINPIYMRLSEQGFLNIRTYAQNNWDKICYLEADLHHNESSLVDEKNILRHEYYLQKECRYYLERIVKSDCPLAIANACRYYFPLWEKLEQHFGCHNPEIDRLMTEARGIRDVYEREEENTDRLFCELIAAAEKQVDSGAALKRCEAVFLDLLIFMKSSMEGGWDYSGRLWHALTLGRVPLDAVRFCTHEMRWEWLYKYAKFRVENSCEHLKEEDNLLGKLLEVYQNKWPDVKQFEYFRNKIISWTDQEIQD